MPTYRSALAQEFSPGADRTSKSPLLVGIDAGTRLQCRHFSILVGISKKTVRIFEIIHTFQLFVGPLYPIHQ